MIQLKQINWDEFTLLCYIKRAAIEMANGMDYEVNDMMADIINIMIDAYCALEEEE